MCGTQGPLEASSPDAAPRRWKGRISVLLQHADENTEDKLMVSRGITRHHNTTLWRPDNVRRQAGNSTPFASNPHHTSGRGAQDRCILDKKQFAFLTWARGKRVQQDQPRRGVRLQVLLTNESLGSGNAASGAREGERKIISTVRQQKITHIFRLGNGQEEKKGEISLRRERITTNAQRDVRKADPLLPGSSERRKRDVTPKIVQRYVAFKKEGESYPLSTTRVPPWSARR